MDFLNRKLRRKLEREAKAKTQAKAKAKAKAQTQAEYDEIRDDVQGIVRSRHSDKVMAKAAQKLDALIEIAEDVIDYIEAQGDYKFNDKDIYILTELVLEECRNALLREYRRMSGDGNGGAK